VQGRLRRRPRRRLDQRAEQIEALRRQRNDRVVAAQIVAFAVVAELLKPDLH